MVFAQLTARIEEWAGEPLSRPIAPGAMTDRASARRTGAHVAEIDWREQTVANGTKTTSEAQQPKQRVAVLGTGTMGTAIARRLLDAGITVYVWNRSPRPALALDELGATAFDDPREAVSAATVVLTLLPTAQTVTDLMIDWGVLAAMAPGAAWAQMGTIGIEASEHLDLEVHSRRPDVRFVDAPVSGSRRPAESGELLVLASGPEAAVQAVGPVFDAIGRRTLWLGPAGMGSRMKLVLNTWLAFEIEAAAEGSALAARYGISPESLAAAIDGNPLASPLASAKLAKIESLDDRPDFSLAWALKDLELMLSSAGSSATPVALAITDRWRSLVDQGFGDLDVSAARLGLGDQPAEPEPARLVAAAAANGALRP
jgi:3-hydroxyisobutyrate dehydrogenase